MITDLLTQINHLNPLRPSRFIQLLYLWQPHLEGSCSSLRVCTGCVCTLEKTQDGEALGFPHSRGWRAAVTERPALSPPGDGGGCDRRLLPAVPGPVHTSRSHSSVAGWSALERTFQPVCGVPVLPRNGAGANTALTQRGAPAPHTAARPLLPQPPQPPPATAGCARCPPAHPDPHRTPCYGKK